MIGERANRPYPGPRPFRQADQARFFGRADDIVTLTRLWQINRLTFMVGKAGRGKTSMLHAGILPSLAHESMTILPVGRLSYGATFPLAALPAHNPYTLALLCSWSPGETATRLAGLTIEDFIRRHAASGPVLAAIDPADELLAKTGPRTVHQQKFLGELAHALREVSQFHLLVIGREQAIGTVADVVGNGVRFCLPELTWPNALEAVVQPMAGTGRSFGDSAAEKLLMDLQADGDRFEPVLLQSACTYLWASLPAELNVITDRDVRRYGDVDAALTAYCGTIIAEVAYDHGITVQQLVAWLRSSFIAEPGATKEVYEGETTTAGMPNAVARALEDRHLLACRPRAAERWYELLNDRLIGPLRNAARAGPPSVRPDTYLRAAERALALGELDLAQRHAKEVLRQPLDANARVPADASTLLGNIALEREKPAEAEARYREAAELSGTVSDTQAVGYQLAAVGQALAAQGRFAEAVDELHAAATRIPNDPVVQVDLAMALWQRGAGHAAVGVLTRALGIDGSNVAALQARGEILADLGEAREAIRDLDRVIRHSPPSTRAARGLALAELGNKSAAREEIEGAVAQAQRNGPVLLYAARAFHESGDDSAARYYARQAASASDPPLSPQHREVARQLASQRRG